MRAPPNLRLAGWRFGPMCSECRYNELRDGSYWCARYDLNVPKRRPLRRL